tara:strand:- start:227 stop:865 length:639 start_codon:yes stop_codon:yes gene_type:complete
MEEAKLKDIEREIKLVTSIKPLTWFLIIGTSLLPLFALPGITETKYKCDYDQVPLVCKTLFTGLYEFLFLLMVPTVVYLGGIYRIKYLLKKKRQILKGLETSKLENEIRAKEREENALRKLEEEQEKLAHLRKFAADDDEWTSFIAKTICVGMHRELVNIIKGVAHDEKRTITSKVTKLTYKYQPYLNARKTTSYKLQVTFIDDRVNAFKDL